MGTRYLKPLADVESGSVWQLGGSVPAASFWQSLDGDSGSNPPASDGDVDFAAVQNASLPGTGVARLRVQVLAAASGTAPPIKRRGHRVYYTFRKAGAGTFLAWPKARLWNDGVEIASQSANWVDPGASYVTLYWELTQDEAALIDWTKSIDVSFDTPTKNTNCALRLTRAYVEFPDAYSLEASGNGTLMGEATGFLVNGTASGSGSLNGRAVGQIVSVSASGSGALGGAAEALLVSGVAAGSGELNGSARGSPSGQGVASGSGSLNGEAEGSVVYYAARGRFGALGATGGAQAVRGA